mmetsp:Transcript_18158/g.41526  ORF Transcript_18158/g.41526 Transcript_18158/m.41526 type:complete len:234 (-) Transcript_18158:17-718(-)
MPRAVPGPQGIGERPFGPRVLPPPPEHGPRDPVPRCCLQQAETTNHGRTAAVSRGGRRPRSEQPPFAQVHRCLPPVTGEKAGRSLCLGNAPIGPERCIGPDGFLSERHRRWCRCSRRPGRDEPRPGLCRPPPPAFHSGEPSRTGSSRPEGPSDSPQPPPADHHAPATAWIAGVGIDNHHWNGHGGPPRRSILSVDRRRPVGLGREQQRRRRYDLAAGTNERGIDAVTSNPYRT